MDDTTLMTIPGHIDPVPVPRDVTPRADGRVDLIGLPRPRIAELFAAAGLDAKAAKLRAKQVYHWLYHRGVTEFEAMTDIAKTMRPWLAERFVIGRPEIVEAQHSSDGTRKWLLRTADSHDYEMVFIPDEARGTLCVSSQVGCTLNCRFCHTGTMRLVRNLTPGEIVGQVMLARDALGEWPKGANDLRPATMAGLDFDDEDEAEDGGEGHYTSDGRLLTNIVMMGMGEPLYNFENVRDALKLVMDGDGLALSKRRITLSTSGVVPMMARCGGWTITTPLCVLDAGESAATVDCFQMPFAGLERTVRVVTRREELGGLPRETAEITRELIAASVVPATSALAPWLLEECFVVPETR